MAMTDKEMAAYLCPHDAENPKVLSYVAALSADKRAVYDRMATVEFELRLWLDGLGPKPAGVLVDLDKRGR